MGAGLNWTHSPLVDFLHVKEKHWIHQRGVDRAGDPVVSDSRGQQPYLLALGCCTDVCAERTQSRWWRTDSSAESHTRDYADSFNSYYIHT